MKLLVIDRSPMYVDKLISKQLSIFDDPISCRMLDIHCITFAIAPRINEKTISASSIDHSATTVPTTAHNASQASSMALGSFGGNFMIPPH